MSVNSNEKNGMCVHVLLQSVYGGRACVMLANDIALPPPSQSVWPLAPSWREHRCLALAFPRTARQIYGRSVRIPVVPSGLN